MNEEASDNPTPEQKKQELFRNQKHTLDLFLERGAISREQYDKSLGGLIRKMGIREEGEENTQDKSILM